MRAIVLEGGRVRLSTAHPPPTPSKEETLVRVLAAGICETDLQLVRGYMGFEGILGHEFVGVAESGPYAGRRVVGEINCSCWTCETCLANRPTHCPNRTTIGISGHDGAFADLIAVPQRNLHPVPDSVATEAAVFTEPVAAAFEIPAQLTLGRESRVVVLGDGRLGTLCAQVLAELCDRVLVVGKHPAKLRILASLGVSTCLLTDKPDDRPADVVVDCTGSASGLRTAVELVRPRGTIVLKTTIAGAQSMEWAPVVVDEITIVGSRCGPFDRALKALAEDRIRVGALVSDRFDLRDGVTALARAADPGVLKVLLDVNAT
jgi:threonine dehydrogenase-like Zn-dependent dehydrogenase